MGPLTHASSAAHTAGTGERAPLRQRVWALNFALVVAILLLDAVTPAGVVVGILLSVPIIVTSVGDSPRLTWITAALATVGFIVVALVGAGPISPGVVWIPNRIFVLLTLPASTFLALYLQKKRLQTERARDEARASSEVSRLLLSLVAHDLRAPLAMAVQAVDYMRGRQAARETGAEDELLRDVDLRLRRSLGSIDGVLRFFRDRPDDMSGTSLTTIDLARDVEAEVDAFRAESAAQFKPIHLHCDASAHAEYRLDGLVLHQCLAIVLDNALRHAREGVIDVEVGVAGGRVRVAVTDGGPAASSEPPAGRSGVGVGLMLCRALIARAGGSMETGRTAEGRTRAVLWLPAEPPG